MARFADLRSPDDRFATIDYTEEPPLLFLGRVVSFDALALRNLRTPVAPQAEVRGLNCASCGAPVELRAGAQTLTAVCGHCLAVVDPLDPSVAIVQEAARRERRAPKIPLGTRGRVRGEEYEVIGFQYRTITVDDEEYGWDEYVLFNPQHGFRYLSEYAGHWNDIKVVSSLPELASRGGRSAARFLGERFRHFQHAVATTRFVLGEFPWRVRVGDEAVVDDYVSPPRMLSAERTGDEVTWSLGEYTPGARVWEMFGLRDRPPRAVGVFANQPSPHTGRPGRYWRLFLAMAGALALVALIRFATAARQEVFAGDYAYASAQAGESAFVTPVFDVPGHTSNLEVGIDTDLSNDWLYLSLALISADTGTAYDFGREVGYYFGRDSDGSWTEGSQQERALLASVPPGRYYLRVEPEGATAGRTVRYRLRLRRDVPSLSIFLVALVLLAVPPSLATWRAAAFETKRWAESDHA
jgi:hypothetical protein